MLAAASARGEADTLRLRRGAEAWLKTKPLVDARTGRAYDRVTRPAQYKNRAGGLQLTPCPAHDATVWPCALVLQPTPRDATVKSNVNCLLRPKANYVNHFIYLIGWWMLHRPPSFATICACSASTFSMYFFSRNSCFLPRPS